MKWFSLLEKGDIHPADEKKIIPAEAFSKLVETEELLEKAKKEATHLVEKAKEEAHHLQEQAKEKGFQKGLEKFNKQILHVDEQLKALRHNLQQMVLPIALKAAKRIVGKELETFPETIVDIVLQAISPITESHRVTIYVNKDDKQYLEEKKSELQQKLDQVNILTIQERPDIEPGGCIIQTEGGMINATIENQWRALERAFKKYE